MNEQLSSLIDRAAWPAVAALVIGLLARAAKEPAVGSLFARIPRQHRPRVVLALGVLAGILDAVVRGTSWPTAIVSGLVSGAVAIAGHGALGGVSPEPTPVKGELPVADSVVDAPPRVTPFTAAPSQDLDFDDPAPVSLGGAP